MNERIKKIRTKIHLSQTAFGKIIGVSLSSVQKWESGQNTPTKQVQYIICDKFDISLTWLATGKGNMVDAQTHDDIEFINSVLISGNETKKQLIRIIAAMPDELLQSMVDYLKSTQKNTLAIITVTF